MSATPAIEAMGLIKKYRADTVVDAVSFSVAAGTVLGLLGPNGAGKTTVVRMLSTLIRLDGGAARICGLDVSTQAAAARRLIGLTGQSTSLDGDLSGEQNVMMVGRLLGLSHRAARARARKLLDDAGLTDAMRRQAKSYSGGMRRRLDLAMSMVGEPSVVFLDEPTTGLDPVGRGETWSTIRRFADRGVAVLLTTQYLEEADHLADQIVVIDHGKVVAEGTADTLKRGIGTQTLDVTVSEDAVLEVAVSSVASLVGSVPAVDQQTRRMSIAVTSPDTMPEIVRALGAAAIGIDELQLRLPTLDDVFVAITGNRSNPVDRRTEASR